MIETGPDRQRTLDAPAAVVAAAYLSGLNMLVVNLQPLILGALADSYGLSDRQLGHIGAIFIGFSTACFVSGPLWVRRVDWRTFSRLMIVLASAALIAGAFVAAPGVILALFAILGLIKGGLGIPSFASLGDSSNPDRNYGVSVGFQAFLSAAVTAPAAAYVIPRFGVSGLFLTIAALVASGLVACRWLPRAGVDGPRRAAEAKVPLARVGILSSSAVAAWIALLAIAAFTGGILGFWYFIERIGVDRGVTHAIIGLTLSLCSLATIGTASIAAWLGGRFPSLTFVCAGSLLILLGFGSLRFHGDAAYTGGSLAFAMGWGLAQPAYYAVIRKVDSTRRLFVAAPAAGGTAGVVIGMVAGPIIEAGGYGAITMASGALIVAGAVGLAAADLFYGRHHADTRAPAIQDQVAATLP